MEQRYPGRWGKGRRTGGAQMTRPGTGPPGAVRNSEEEDGGSFREKGKFGRNRAAKRFPSHCLGCWRVNENDGELETGEEEIGASSALQKKPYPFLCNTEAACTLQYQHNKSLFFIFPSTVSFRPSSCAYTCHNT
jgi:hypothetical protein